MSSETSIVVKMTDRFSDAAKGMAKTTRAFAKDVEGLEKSLYELTQNKAELRIDLKQAKDQLREAEARFRATGSEVDRLSYMFAHVQVDNLTRNLKTVNKAITENEKSISNLQNKAGGLGGFFGAAKALEDSIVAIQFAQMYAQSLGQVAHNGLSSFYGNTTEGIVLSGALSGVASGASIGFSVAGIYGAAIGSVLGGVSGVISGLAQDYENKDDFFKDYYNKLYEDQLSAGEESLTAGSATAGSREQSYKAFEKRLGTAQANAYLAEVKSMAARTNYGYDEILGYSKLLLNSYAPDETFGLLTTLSDATAGLGLNSSDVEMFIKGFSRMRTTGKVTQEYLTHPVGRGLAPAVFRRGRRLDAPNVQRKRCFCLESCFLSCGQNRTDAIVRARILRA